MRRTRSLEVVALSCLAAVACAHDAAPNGDWRVLESEASLEEVDDSALDEIDQEMASIFEETKRDLERSREQRDRYDELLDRWEAQADRMDRVLDLLERRASE